MPIYFALAVFFMVIMLTWVTRSFIVLREYERAVTFWLGKLSGEPKGPA